MPMAGTAHPKSKRASARDNPVSKAFGPVHTAFWGVAVVSFVINILMLTGPVFMLQVYDRVLASGSVPTLVVIGTLAIVLYAFYGLPRKPAPRRDLRHPQDHPGGRPDPARASGYALSREPGRQAGLGVRGATMSRRCG